MSVLEEGLTAYLKAYAGLTAKVGQRIYPVKFPQSTTMPCVVFQRIDTPRELTHDSAGATGDLAHPRFQMEVWAETYAAGKEIVDLVRAALNGKKGVMGSVTIRAALVDNESVEYSTDFELYRFLNDYIIWIQE
jgi:gamma-glutamyltranspeptidase